MLLSKSQHHVPRGAAVWGMLLFLASLSVLFAASMVGYFWIRITGAKNSSVESIHLPSLFWVSTLLMLAASYAISRALRAVQREQQESLRRNLWIALALAMAFVGVQTPALGTLLHDHQQLAKTGVTLYGILFFLVLLHALHVIGGVVSLSIVTRGAAQHRYDHEHHLAVRSAAWYWHFLDVVWLVMFLSLWCVG